MRAEILRNLHADFPTTDDHRWIALHGHSPKKRESRRSALPGLPQLSTVPMGLQLTTIGISMKTLIYSYRSGF
ncbi:hypothetical protein CK224_19210 [Mesorhizobium sp. WSM3862]|nr:hypothetical protein CK224_19210 [Mesorhizobium sp. WSM3862]